MEVSLVNVTNNPLETIEKVACNCYDSEPTDDFHIAETCYNSGHLSVFEFAQFHFHIEGVSRALLAQITRHRTGKFCVRSQRYCVENGFEYVTPPSIKANREINKYYDACMDMIKSFYDSVVEIGIPPEDARMILPNACETIIDVSFDFRNLMHFFNERLCKNAQWEIRSLACRMRDLIISKYPELKKYCVPKCEAHSIPYCTERKCCGRHNKLSSMIKETETNNEANNLING